MQLSVYFSNLHYDFTSCNSNLANYEKATELRRHGIPLKLFKHLNPTSTIEDILAIRLPVFHRGVCSRFFLVYDYKQIKHIFVGSQFQLYNSLSCFFNANMKKEFAEEYSLESQNKPVISEMFGIYLTSLIFSFLSRYRMNLWVKLVDGKNSINFYINYFLRFAKQAFLKNLFDKLFRNESFITRLLNRFST